MQSTEKVCERETIAKVHDKNYANALTSSEIQFLEMRMELRIIPW
jgi:hypothetical protein